MRDFQASHLASERSSVVACTLLWDSPPVKRRIGSVEGPNLGNPATYVLKGSQNDIPELRVNPIDRGGLMTVIPNGVFEVRNPACLSFLIVVARLLASWIQ
jgi:hypothetical protein